MATAMALMRMGAVEILAVEDGRDHANEQHVVGPFPDFWTVPRRS
jgi:hypothetical protein